MPQYFVHLAQLASPDLVSPEDAGLAGVYEVEVRGSQDDPHVVTAVLDAFHDHIGIDVLEDFEIGVKNEEGVWVAESDNEDDPDPEDMPVAVFLGKVEGRAPEQEPCQPRGPGARMFP